MATPTTTKTYTIQQLIADHADLIDGITTRKVDRTNPGAFPAHLEEAAEVLEGGLLAWIREDADELTAAAAYLGDALSSSGADEQTLLSYAAKHLGRVDATDYL